MESPPITAVGIRGVLSIQLIIIDRRPGLLIPYLDSEFIGTPGISFPPSVTGAPPARHDEGPGRGSSNSLSV